MVGDRGDGWGGGGEGMGELSGRELFQRTFDYAEARFFAKSRWAADGGDGY